MAPRANQPGNQSPDPVAVGPLSSARPPSVALWNLISFHLSRTMPIWFVKRYVSSLKLALKERNVAQSDMGEGAR